MVFQLGLHSGLDNSNFEGTDQPGKKIANSFILQQISLNKYDTLPEEKEDNLDSTDDGKASEETVPPIRLKWASVLIFLSLSMSSKVAVSK